ncbi:MAG: riboflavin synthase [Lachnospiraceae bacterium]|nr:riboflavin synthase [Lachnospiraceae bacterium]MBQ2089435.1 riboflavin synthase [Lachnospiraceae bacterium]
MFTGIVEEKGILLEKQIHGISGTLRIGASKVLEGTQIGDSIAVNGVCLTVTSLGDGFFTADVMAETMRRSSMGTYMPGAHVNLERAMIANGRFGGHIVSGHIDGTGEISSIITEENATLIGIRSDRKILDLIVEKGSIAIDGISLTVASVSKEDFTVSIIPHTGDATILSERKVGDKVNLENDMVGKYVQKLLGLVNEPEQNASESALSMDMLEQLGF